MTIDLHSRIRFRRLHPRTQHGAALLFVVLLLVIGTGLFIINASQETVRVVQSDTTLASGLNAAKEALIAYAVAHPNRPGALPCPAVSYDGQEAPLTAGACPAYIGRLPWRTLGLGDVRDESGEHYWYALSENFRDGLVVNSDSKGNLTVSSVTAAGVTLSTGTAAVIFSPGGVLPGQSRDAMPAACATTGSTIARDLCAANYLDSTSGANNAAAVPVPVATRTYVMTEAGPAFNDRLIAVRTSDVIPLVERRVAADIRRTLLLYREAARLAVTKEGCNCYPWPDSDGDVGGTSNVGQNKGRIPLTPSPHPWSPQPPAAPINLADASGKTFPLPPLPSYFVANEWNKVIFYAVGRNALENLGDLCTTCTNDPLLPPPTFLKGTLSIDKNIGHAVILITPGSAGANRPVPGGWGNYIDDGMNRDGDDRFVTPKSKSPDRDRLLTIPDDLPPASCRTNSQILIKNAPCHTTGSDSKPVCKRAVHNLKAHCGCAPSGEALIEEPCRNTLNPPDCEAAVATLQACKG
jgi:hypothetical protein